MGCTYSVYGVGKKKKLSIPEVIVFAPCIRIPAQCGSAITELRQALEEYLPILVGLTKKEHGLEDSVEFKWKNLEDGRQETSVANAWFELLSVVHIMAMLTLSEADTLMIPKDYSGSGFRVVSTGTNGNGSSIQGTGIQLGLAVESQKATLSAKRRLACELLIYYSQV
ncbi:hypothetical protein V6N13_111745 [Hibiscus sabdariffa]